MKNLNQETANKLDLMEGLTDHAREVIATTDINIFAEVFGGLETAEEVNAYVEEYYPEEV